MKVKFKQNGKMKIMKELKDEIGEVINECVSDGKTLYTIQYPTQVVSNVEIDNLDVIE